MENKIEIGYVKGEFCNREGCKGIIDEPEKEKGCSCHINPPCSSCVNTDNYCPVCDWQGYEDQKMAAFNYSKNELPERKHYEDDGLKYEVRQYFDDVFERVVGSNLSREEAYQLSVNKKNERPRHYVSFDVKPMKTEKEALEKIPDNKFTPYEGFDCGA